MKIILLSIGACLLAAESSLAFSPRVQFILFIAGILFIGIPHGAADLLVATKNSTDTQSFSPAKFHLKYLVQLATFAMLFWVFPVDANFVFLILAACHFGETDLAAFDNTSLAGKCLMIIYGILILAVILLPHFETLEPLFALFKSGRDSGDLIQFVDRYRYELLSLIGALFLISLGWYIRVYSFNFKQLSVFLAEYLTLLIILFFLPMILGFTFYFVLWHSLFSLRNIIRYLRGSGSVSLRSIVRQITVYSLISFAGFLIFGCTGILFLSTDSIIAYVFLALAVLTAPHVQVMHKMYKRIKTQRFSGQHVHLSKPLLS